MKKNLLLDFPADKQGWLEEFKTCREEWARLARISSEIGTGEAKKAFESDGPDGPIYSAAAKKARKAGDKAKDAFSIAAHVAFNICDEIIKERRK